MKVTIEIADEFTVATRDGASVKVDAAKLHTEILPDVFAYGLGQKVRDARSAAKSLEESQSMMDECVAKLYAGEWTRRGMGGEGVDEWTRHARVVMRQLMKAGTDSKDWAKFTGLSDANQLAKIDANIEANRGTIQESVDARVAEFAKRVKDRKALAKKITVSL